MATSIRFDIDIANDLKSQQEISFPEPAKFLPRMLDENEGLWKGPVLIVRK